MPKIKITGLPKAAGGKQMPMGPFIQPDDNQNFSEAVPTINGPVSTTTMQPFSEDDSYDMYANQMNKNSQNQLLNKGKRTLKTSLNLIDSFADYSNKKNQQAAFDNMAAANGLYDNMLNPESQSTSGFRGNRNQHGQFRPNEQGWKNETAYSAAYGGSMNNTKKYKIKITGGPEDNKSMAYGGQMGYGLDLNGKRVYTDMPDFKSEKVSNTLGPVNRSEANIEAERGETLWGDVDGDGALEHMKIGGKRHVDGGTPLDAPEGSFIFSDTAKMKIKDSKILDKFGVAPRKDGWTPAEIAKRYDINKYKAILEDKTTDEIRKATAQIMIKNFTKKLSDLALVQEQMKGFPQGIPDVAKKSNPELKTEQDQQIQHGVSDNPDIQQEQQAAPPQEEQPTMAYGGLIQEFGNQYNDFEDVLPKAELGSSGLPNPFNSYLKNNKDVAYSNVPVNNIPSQPVQPTTDSQGNIIYGQTFTPEKYADLNDPDYKEFQALMTKLNQKNKNYGSNVTYINKLGPGEGDRLAQLATKFGFKRDAQGNMPGHRIVQGATSGYNFSDGKQQIGFFGGYTPDMYEKKVIESSLGKEASDKMSDVQRRRAFFKQIGIDDTKFSDAQLANTRSVYNKNFFKNTFYPAYSKSFNKEGYRPEMKDDMMMAAEHYDALKIKPPEVVTTTTTPPVVETTTYPPPGTVNIPHKKIEVPFDYMAPDVVNFNAALGARPNKYLGWASRIPFQNGNVAFEDWRAKAAERQSMMNRTANQLNTYSPGSGAAANLSFLNGQSSEGLIGDIANTDARNVATANQFSNIEANRRDNNNLANWQQQQNLITGNAIANQNYDNAYNQYNNNLAKSFGNAWNNRMKLGLMNNVNPYFKVDPRSGYSSWSGQGRGVDQLGSMSNSGSGTDWASVGKEYATAKAAHPQLAGMTFEQFQKERGKTSTTDTNNDGIPNSVRHSGYGPAQYAGMYNF